MIHEGLNIDPAAVPVEQIPALMAALAGLEIALASRLMQQAPAAAAEGDEHDALLTVEETAQRLRRSPKWVYRHASDLPFTRHMGRSLVFSEKGLEKWIARQKA